jgi:uncharacterized glyoxalase superfamily protein PhnB
MGVVAKSDERTEASTGLSLAPGHHGFNPHFVVDGANDFIDFLVDVFDGREDTTYQKAVTRGCVSGREPGVTPWGDRGAGFTDRWWVSPPAD